SSEEDAGFFAAISAGCGSLLRIILRLGMPEGVVNSVLLCEQLLMAAALDDLSAVEHGNVSAEPAGGKPVADIHGCFVLHDLVEPGIDLVLRDRVERGGRFIEDDERR